MSSTTPAARPAPAGPPAQLCDGHGEALTAAFSLLGKRWNGVLIGVLSRDSVGFADLRRRVGPIADSVLSDRLTELGRAGIVERVVTDTRPPGVTYRLTAAGHELLPVLDAVARWARAHLPERCTGPQSAP